MKVITGQELQPPVASASLYAHHVAGAVRACHTCTRHHKLVVQRYRYRCHARARARPLLVATTIGDLGLHRETTGWHPDGMKNQAALLPPSDPSTSFSLLVSFHCCTFRASSTEETLFLRWCLASAARKR